MRDASPRRGSRPLAWSLDFLGDSVSVKEQFALRLNEALDRYGAPAKGKGRQLWLGKLLNVSPIAARKWLEGQGLPRTERILAVARKLGVSEEWLLSGNKNEIPATSLLLDADEERLIKRYRELSSPLRRALLSLVRELKKE